jgi:hypothetical protein
MDDTRQCTHRLLIETAESSAGEGTQLDLGVEHPRLVDIGREFRSTRDFVDRLDALCRRTDESPVAGFFQRKIRDRLDGLGAERDDLAKAQGLPVAMDDTTLFHGAFGYGDLPLSGRRGTQRLAGHGTRFAQHDPKIGNAARPASHHEADLAHHLGREMRCKSF